MKMLFTALMIASSLPAWTLASEVAYSGAEARSLYMSLVALQVQNPDAVKSGAGSGAGGWVQTSLWSDGPSKRLACTKSEYRSGKVTYTCTVGDK